MRILEIIPSLSSGGAERFVTDLSNELSKNNEIYVVTLFPLTDEYNFYLNEISSNIKVISLNKCRGFSLRVIFKLLFLIGKLKPNVVHTHIGTLEYVFLANILKYHKCRFFHTVHSDAFKEGGAGVRMFLRKYLFQNKLSTPITISQESEDSFFKAYGFKGNLIYNGRAVPVDNIEEGVADLVSLRKSPNTIVLLNVARIVPLKNQILLVKCVNKLCQEGYDIQLAIIGSYKDDSKTYNEILENTSNSVHLLGERKNIFEYLKVSDAFCLTSVYEGFPISFIESLAAGVISICTPVGGLKDVIVNNENGFLSIDLTEKSYIKALKNFIDSYSNNDKRLEMKESIKNTFSQYTIETCACKYFDLFNKMTD